MPKLSNQSLTERMQVITKALATQRDDTAGFINSFNVIAEAEELTKEMQSAGEIKLSLRLMFNVASHYSRNSELQKAKELFETILTTYKLEQLDDEKFLADVLQTYGTNFIRLGNAYKAEDILKQALEIRKKCYDINAIELPKGYNPILHTAISYGSSIVYNLDMPIQERMEKAHATVQNAVTAFEEHFKLVKLKHGYKESYLPYQIAEGKVILGYLHRLSKNFGEAQKYFQEALAFYTDPTYFPKSHIDIVRLYNNLGYLALEEENNVQRALNYFTSGIKAVENLPPNNHHLISAYIEVAKLHNILKNSYAEKAIALANSIYGKDHSLSQEAQAIKDVETKSALRRYALNFLSSNADEAEKFVEAPATLKLS